MLPGLSSPQDLDRAIRESNVTQVAETARAVAAGDDRAAAKALSDAILDSGKIYDKAIAAYLANRKGVQALQGASSKDLGQTGSPEFDDRLKKSYALAQTLINAEKCALEVAKACAALSSGEAVDEMIRRMKQSGRTTFGDYLAEALGHARHPSAIDALAGQLKARCSWQMKVAALDGLGMKSGEKSRLLGIVSGYLSDDDVRIQKAALAAQQALNGGGGGPAPGGKAKAAIRSGAAEGATFYEMRVDSDAVMFVVDSSHSMTKGGRFDTMRAELRKAVSGLPDKGVVNIVDFNCLVRFMSPRMVTLDRRSRPAIEAHIAKMNMGYVTNTFETFQTVFRIIRGEFQGGAVASAGGRSDRVADTIFFLTDGKPTVPKRLRNGELTRYMDPDLICDWVRFWNRRSRVTINTIGIGEGKGDFLERLARENGGKSVSR